MHIKEKVIIVTGAASGIGRALAERVREEGAAAVVVCDIDAAKAKAVADRIGGLDGVLTPAEVADVAVQALAEKRFLALPHPEVQHYFQHKAADHDRWITAMQRLRHKFPAG